MNIILKSQDTSNDYLLILSDLNLDQNIEERVVIKDPRNKNKTCELKKYEYENKSIKNGNLSHKTLIFYIESSIDSVEAIKVGFRGGDAINMNSDLGGFFKILNNYSF